MAHFLVKFSLAVNADLPCSICPAGISCVTLLMLASIHLPLYLEAMMTADISIPWLIITKFYFQVIFLHYTDNAVKLSFIFLIRLTGIHCIRRYWTVSSLFILPFSSKSLVNYQCKLQAAVLQIFKMLSWRRWWLHQPPITRLAIECRFHHKHFLHRDGSTSNASTCR